MGFCWNTHTEKWEMAFNDLQIYRRENGHCRVDEDFVTREKKFKLGVWVLRQRQDIKKGRITPDRVKRLDSLGFTWDTFSEQWETSFLALQSFYKREGHLRVPADHLENQIRIERWAIDQRRRKNKLTSDQLLRLNAIGFSWNPVADLWEYGFAKLLEFRKREGHCQVEHSVAENGFRLGMWVLRQRQEMKRGALLPEKIRRLDSIGFSWDPVTERWEAAFNALTLFQKEYGHCRVPENFASDKLGFKLGLWVSNLRIAKTKGRLPLEQIRRLDSLAFSWDPRTEQWEQAFAALKQYRAREGHCLISANQVVCNMKLGSWVQTQRKNKSQLSSDRIKRLNALGFSWKA
jgi:hypothetical protein